MPLAEPDFLDILRRFSEQETEVLVVGGVAAIFHGSPLMTQDVDFVYRQQEDNLAKILEVLEELDTSYRDPAKRMIKPTIEKLRTMQTHLFNTASGPLDLLQEIGAGHRYETLRERSSWFELDGFSIVVLDLEAIIQSKTEAGRPKDLYALPLLREILDNGTE